MDRHILPSHEHAPRIPMNTLRELLAYRDMSFSERYIWIRAHPALSSLGFSLVLAVVLAVPIGMLSGASIGTITGATAGAWFTGWIIGTVILTREGRDIEELASGGRANYLRELRESRSTSKLVSPSQVMIAVLLVVLFAVSSRLNNGGLVLVINALSVALAAVWLIRSRR